MFLPKTYIEELMQIDWSCFQCTPQRSKFSQPRLIWSKIVEEYYETGRRNIEKIQYKRTKIGVLGLFDGIGAGRKDKNFWN